MSICVHKQGNSVTFILLKTGRPIAARPQVIDPINLARVELGKPPIRDEKKRATHNEVERRRRDKINAWITKLSKIIPGAAMDGSTKQSQV